MSICIFDFFSFSIYLSYDFLSFFVLKSCAELNSYVRGVRQVRVQYWALRGFELGGEMLHGLRGVHRLHERALCLHVVNH